MARYIDANKMVAKDNAYTTFPYDLAGCDDNDLVRWINEQPTADVVPKSEVEMLQGALKAEERHNELTMETAQKALANAKAEVAREIFEEIGKRFEALLKFYPCNGEFEDAKSFVDFHWKHIRHSIMCDYDSELKKKYTEGCDD